MTATSAQVAEAATAAGRASRTEHGDTVVSLRMLDEVAGEDVAAMLELPSSHVAVLLHRAKQNRRRCMLSAGYRP
jgi:DNA-directed RNA polymerase specialized sigma24 family protein